MKKSLVVFLIFLCALSLILGACRGRTGLETGSVSDQAAVEVEASEDASASDSSADSASKNDSPPRTISAKLEENLSIDALVNAPDRADIALPCVSARLLCADAEQACRVLFPGVTVQREVNYDGSDSRSFELEGERYLTVGSGTISGEAPLGEVVTQLYALEGILNDETLRQPDLDFASRDEVIQNMLADLAELGLDNVRCAKAYALSAEYLQSTSDDMLSQPDLAEDIRGNRIAFKDTWTKDDECYVLKMQYVVGDDELPVFVDNTAKSYSFTEVHYENYTLEAVVSKDGIESIRAFRAFETLEAGPAEAIISPDDVVKLISDYYQNLIVEYPTEIREITLNYILLPVEGENAYELRPSWCCRAESQYGSADEYETSWIVFDAITGQVHY